MHLIKSWMTKTCMQKEIKKLLGYSQTHIVRLENIICTNFDVVYSHQFIYCNYLQLLIDIYNGVAK